MTSLSDLLGRQIARVRRSIELLTADRAQLPAPSVHPPRERVAPVPPALRSLLAFAAGDVEVLILSDGWGMWWDAAGQVSTAALPADLFASLRASLPELTVFVDEVGLPYRRVPPGVAGTGLTIVPDPRTGEKIEIIVAPGAIPPRYAPSRLSPHSTTASATALAARRSGPLPLTSCRRSQSTSPRPC
jgi:hypothetical protein